MSSELATEPVRIYDPEMISPPPPKKGREKSFQVRISAEADEKLMRIIRHGPYSQNEAILEAIDFMYRALVEDEKAASKKSTK